MKELMNRFQILILQYSDIAMETLLLKCQPVMEKATGLKLYPAYTYARIYKKGDELKRHKDRFSCEISTTMNLGGDDWPIYLEPSGKEGKKGIKVDLKPGDMLVYSGCELEHWRKNLKVKNAYKYFFIITIVKHQVLKIICLINDLTFRSSFLV
jgi:alkylated DNA repair dioxygenase AlkB